MSSAFKTIGLIGKPDHRETCDTLSTLYAFLKEKGYSILVETESARQLPFTPDAIASITELGETADLAVVVGGDGRMLGAARVLSRFDIAVIGVNRGNLGFLTDLDPDNLLPPLEEVLKGKYVTEHRYLLETQVIRHNEIKSSNSAMNEVVLHHERVASLLEFEVYIDGHFMLSQRADGLIISTPTGSTAYSLSAGGPIISPRLDAITLVPMFPHTLSSRPIVVDSLSEIRLRISRENADFIQVSCDSHVALPVQPGDEVVIRKQAHALRLVHPKDYDYFKVLRSKLGWGSKLF